MGYESFSLGICHLPFNPHRITLNILQEHIVLLPLVTHLKNTKLFLASIYELIPYPFSQRDANMIKMILSKAEIKIASPHPSVQVISIMKTNPLFQLWTNFMSEEPNNLNEYPLCFEVPGRLHERVLWKRFCV